MGEKMIDGGIELGNFDIDSFLSQTEVSTKSNQIIDAQVQRQIVLAIDASNSMMGAKIGAVNEAVNNLISKLKSYDRSPTSAISICVVGYSSRLFRWTNGFVPIRDFKFSYVEMVDGISDINSLLRELSVLSEEHMIDEANKFVILFSDGLPTVDYKLEMDNWKKTKNYTNTKRIAISFDDDLTDAQSRSFFHDFTESDAILSIKEPAQLLNILIG